MSKNIIKSNFFLIKNYFNFEKNWKIVMGINVIHMCNKLNEDRNGIKHLKLGANKDNSSKSIFRSIFSKCSQLHYNCIT